MALVLDNCESILLSLDSPHGHHKSSSVPAPFLIKTYQLVDDPTTDHIVSWGDDHTTVVVWRPLDFARDLIPNYFKHNNFSSFVRQLNTYGFRKIVLELDRWEFANEFFRKGEKHLLCEIHRRKTSHPSQLAVTNHHQYPHSPTACGAASYPYSTQISISPPKIQIQQVQMSDSLTPGVTLQSIMKTSSLPNLNRETTSSPTFFSLFQDPDHHDDTTLNKRPKIDSSQYTESSDTSPLKVASAHVNNNNNNDHRALDAASALMDEAQSCCGSNSYGGDVEECSLGSSSRSGYSVSDDGNTSQPPYTP